MSPLLPPRCVHNVTVATFSLCPQRHHRCLPAAALPSRGEDSVVTALPPSSRGLLGFLLHCHVAWSLLPPCRVVLGFGILFLVFFLDPKTLETPFSNKTLHCQSCSWFCS
ncbi:hypothetical protein VIGAN_08061400 [Vigna angularis var. angularis]|uniref:Uncharacterized protein n=1 Tax=Vigna angularis var. angularis TaxID=157739 RepID=A0A0S3SMI7_PHAAN|nr:hypothetical protein VIGAN_08061400 [Vigna angularis var. angularis]